MPDFVLFRDFVSALDFGASSTKGYTVILWKEFKKKIVQIERKPLEW